MFHRPERVESGSADIADRSKDAGRPGAAFRPCLPEPMDKY
jgi:hypothetical protein